jgi:hypothetical protein
MHPSSNKSSPAIEYINDQWYLLSWDEGKFYTNPSLQIELPINLDLSAQHTFPIHQNFLPQEPRRIASISDLTREGDTTSEEDEQVFTSNQREDNDLLALGFDASYPSPIATITLQNTTITGESRRRGAPICIIPLCHRELEAN